jgi:hypothetical protein
VVKHLAQHRTPSFEENLNTAKKSYCVGDVSSRYPIKPTRHYAQVFSASERPPAKRRNHHRLNERLGELCAIHESRSVNNALCS